MGIIMLLCHEKRGKENCRVNIISPVPVSHARKPGLYTLVLPLLPSPYLALSLTRLVLHVFIIDYIKLAKKYDF